MYPEVTFAAPWSKALKITTSLILLLILGVGAAGVLSTHSMPLFASGVLLGVSLFLLIGTALFAIRGFKLAPGELRIQRLLWSTRISLADLSSARLDRDAMAGSIRLFGVGGFLCYCGLFRNRKLGNYWAYATNPVNSVVLKFPSKTIVLTPNEPVEFVKVLNQPAAQSSES